MLLILAGVAFLRTGIARRWLQFILAPSAAALFELVGRKLAKRKLRPPSSAVISGLIIALVLQPGVLWYVPVFAALAAIGSKYLLRIDGRHIFNPAAFGLMLSAIIFGVYFFWWGAPGTTLVILLGSAITLRYRRLHLILPFLSLQLLIMTVYYGSLSVAALMVNYFFVFVMLIEPKTSPVKKRGRIIYGLSAAILISALVMLDAPFDPWIGGLLAANLTVPFLNRKAAVKNSGVRP